MYVRLHISQIYAGGVRLWGKTCGFC